MGQSRRVLVTNFLGLADAGTLSHGGSSFLAFRYHVYSVMHWYRQRCGSVLGW
jgi:hypothetical protein